MTQKFPPPPYLASQDPDTQRLNRWLLEIQSILNASGGIDPASIPGLPATITQTTANTTAIAALQASSGGQSTAILNLQYQFTILSSQIATLNSSVTTLIARAQVLNGVGGPAGGLGNINDWYADTTNAKIYVKTAIGTWTLVSTS